MVNLFKSLFYSENFLKKFLLLFGVDVLVMFFVFSISGFYNDRIDTAIYVSQIEDFSMGGTTGSYESSFRLFKPFYGIIGSWLTFVFPPITAILFINILFFIGLTFLSYLFFIKLNFNVLFSTVGAIWVATGYPIFKYGLALGTDISGWFFAVATIVVFLCAVSQNYSRYIIFSSLIGFLGSLTKETGLLGLIFSGVFILMHINVWSGKKVISWLLFLCAPFFVLQTIFLFIVSSLGAPTFLDWFKLNQGHTEYYSKFFRFLGVEGSAFNIILILSVVGIFLAIKNRDILKRNWLKTYVPLFVASLPVLFWTTPLSRVLYIQFIFFIPLSLYGLVKLHKRHVIFYLMVLPPLFSLGLFLLVRNDSMFDLVKQILT